MAYRYWCGECGFKSSWGTESEGEREQLAHYARNHPGIVPGGQVETDGRSPSGGSGCLTFLGIVIVLVILAASCHR
ncbi:hypothetical protein [Streptomyces sp. NPDC049590]|uniref:hypothetical protein n=1 Tax=Streptomyces sp. NPDC049590 TaxID=3154834 RepID=UPI0034140795